uniref:Beta-glucosidase A n=1 Tax=uncultured bacterium Contig248 TaxID=1393544 RepID=W0FM68_9BACT|nr:beta-glucosidase A [uncultured bacterium Contig248]
MSFPNGFLLGAATAAHQVEGNNTNSDFWAQELLPHSSFLEPSGIACDHYNRYEEDIRLLAAAGLNAYRFSVEWARIEPEEGRFDDAEIAHYQRVIDCCLENGVEPVLTLFHFTSPVWLIKKGGWEAESTVEYFRRYAAYVIERLGAKLHTVCTINEANMGLQLAAISKRYQLMAERMKKMAAARPAAAGESAKNAEGKVQVGMNFQKMMENAKFAAMENAQVFGTPQPHVFVSPKTPEGDILGMRAHQAAKEAIKALYPDMKVGLTLSLHDLQALPGGESFVETNWADEFTHYLPYLEGDDFLGVQNYTRTLYGPEGQLPAPEGAELTQMDYEFYPEGLEHVIRKVHEGFSGDLIVTENGIATADDSRRVEFIRRAVAGVERCLADGIPVKGYFYWSLMDNFEWQKGFSMQFGLIAVDRETMERTPKESLKVLGSL